MDHVYPTKKNKLLKRVFKISDVQNKLSSYSKKTFSILKYFCQNLVLQHFDKVLIFVVRK